MKINDIIQRNEKDYIIKEKTCTDCQVTSIVAVEHGHGNYRSFDISSWKTWNGARCSECHKKYNAERRKKPNHTNCDQCGKPLDAKRSLKRYCSKECRMNGYIAMRYAKRDSHMDKLLAEHDIPDNSEDYVNVDKKGEE